MFEHTQQQCGSVLKGISYSRWGSECLNIHESSGSVLKGSLSFSNGSAFESRKREGGCLMSPPCLESRGRHLIPIFCLLSIVVLRSSVAFSPLSLFLLLIAHNSDPPPILQYISVKRYALSYGSCLAAWR